MQFKKTHSLTEVFKDLKKRSLVVLDLDNTLIECTTSYGSYQWIVHLIRQAVQQGETLVEALARLVPLWEDLQHHLQMQSIEEQASVWLAELKSQGHLLLGLTGRSGKIKEVTLRELKRNQLCFAPPQNLSEDLFSSLEEVTYQEGVIFVGPNQCKGDVLSQLLQSIDLDIEDIIFVDDQKDYVSKVSEALRAFHYPFACYQFVGLTEKVQSFNYQTALEEQKRLFSSS